MKNLEEFIRDNREEFDRYEPGKEVWEKLEQEFSQKHVSVTNVKKVLWLKWGAVAAALVILVFATYNFYKPNSRDGNPPTVAMSSVPEEYATEMNHFTHIIELKHKELQKIQQQEPELYRKFSADIQKLDSSYQMLKKELPGNPDEAQVLEAMIQNLKYQMDLLSEQLIIIQKIQQVKKSNNEKVYKSI